MMYCHRICIILSVLLHRWTIATAEEQNYFFGSQRFPQSYQSTQNRYVNTQNFDPFRQPSTSFGSFSSNFRPSTDLDTSDLPPHLQRTLPQYQLSLFENPSDQNFKLHPASSFQASDLTNGHSGRFGQQVAPSTHRPNYSHLFSRTSHNHDPSQTETFLGEITIQSPADLPIEFQNRNVGGFQPSVHFPIQIPPHAPTKPNNKNNNSKSNSDTSSKSLKPSEVVDQHLDHTEKPVTFGGGSRANFLNHRTRIFAPESGNRPQVNDYFVNSNGEVFITTRKTDYIPEPTISPPKYHNELMTSTERHVTVSTSEALSHFPTQETRTIENTFNLDSLLEEPVDKSEHSSNKDNVEVIQAITLSPDKFYFPNMNASSATVTDTDIDYATSTDDKQDDYDYESTDTYDDEHTTSVDEETTESTELNTVEGGVIDKKSKHTDESKLPSVTNLNHNASSYDVLTMKPSTMVKDDNFQKFVDTSVIDHTTKPPLIKSEPMKNIEDAVISVVTTKSIINNTVIGTIPTNTNITEQMAFTTQPTILKTNSHKATTNSDTLEQISSPKHTDEEISTEGWVVVASVQTSRSVSGARYLPFAVVEQHERTKFLNEPVEPDKEVEEEMSTTPSSDNYTTTMETNDKQNTSTESLTDKLDRVQSDLSGSLLTGSFNNEASNIAVITEGQLDKSDETTMFDGPSAINSTMRTSSIKPSSQGSPPVVIRKFSPHARPTTTSRNKIGLKPRYQPRKANSPVDIDKPQNDQPLKLLIPDVKHKNGTTGRSSGISNQNQIIVQDVHQPKEAELSQKTLESLLNKIKFKETSALLPPDYHKKIPQSPVTNKTDYKSDSTSKPDDVLTNVKQVDISALLPPGYKFPNKDISSTPSTVSNSVKQFDLSSLLPPGYNVKSEENNTSNILEKSSQTLGVPNNSSKNARNNTDVLSSLFQKSKQDDISAFLPPGYKPPKNKPDTASDILKPSVIEDISAFLPPGYKLPKSTTTKPVIKLFENAKQEDISAFLPPGYKVTTEKTNEEPILKKSPLDENNAMLPPDYKFQKESNSTKSKPISLLENAKSIDISAFLPPGFKAQFNPSKSTTTTTESSVTTEKIIKETTTTAGSSNFKLVFPSRPGGVHRKNSKPSTTKTSNDPVVLVNTPPSIHKGWPSRATTEFTGWPTPSTTPLSIEKILERARAAVGATTSTTSSSLSTTTGTTTTTTSTTTARPTTPGLCVTDCDLAGTIKLIGGAKWVPELLDRNTKEWQILANEVQYQLEDIYSKSDVLSKWYKKIRIDGFSEGSVLVDYLVELNNVSRQINTRDLKTLFHNALEDAFSRSASNREAKSSDLGNSLNENGKLVLGNFMVDPTFTDFVVLPKQILPTVGYAEDNVLLPQWAIAIIVIGLASLLFVIIFGVTVIVNKQKNAKKKQPSTLTEEMLNELNKNHMGGIDNYGADDLYNMEDVWNDKPYETKLPKKRSAGSLHDNSMPNIYDSWRSEWNGYYYNTYYGNHPGSSHSGYGRRRSDYDTNF